MYKATIATMAPGRPPKEEISEVSDSTVAEDVTILDVDEDVSNLVEDGVEVSISRKDKSVRLVFVRKVLGTVGLQLLFCTLFSALCIFQPDLNAFLKRTGGQAVTFTSLFFSLVVIITIICCKVGHGKPNPINITLLIILTVLVSVCVGCSVVFYLLNEIIISVGTTMGVLFIMLAISFHPTFDITGRVVYVLVAFLALLLYTLLSYILFSFGVLPVTWEATIIIKLVGSLGFTILYAMMVLYNLKLIVGGGAEEIKEEEWLLASIFLFSSNIAFFLQFLDVARLFRR